MKLKFAVFALWIAAMPLAAQDFSTWEKVLLPAWTPNAISGVDGTQFITTFQVQAHDRPVQLYPMKPSGAPSQPVVGTLQPNVTDPSDPFVVAGSSPAGGRLLYVEPGGPSNLSFGYGLTSVTKDHVAYYTALPLVRARDFSTSDVTIHLVPTWPVGPGPFPTTRFNVLGYRQRHALYVYDVDNTGTLRAEVGWGINAQSPNAGGAILSVTRRDADDPTYPYYVRVDLDTIVPPCIGIIDNNDCDAAVRTIRVHSLTPGVHFWAFVATTDNQTQAVTIEAPQ